MGFLAPVADDDARAIDDFTGVAFAVEDACFWGKEREGGLVNGVEKGGEGGGGMMGWVGVGDWGLGFFFFFFRVGCWIFVLMRCDALEGGILGVFFRSSRSERKRK